MKTMELLRTELKTSPFALTENGDPAYTSTLNANLDFFALVGGMRFNPKKVRELFARALSEDYSTAIKNLFYTRDIRGGMGERRSFRVCFRYLCDLYPADAATLFPFVVEYGRFDDLFEARDTKAEGAMIDFVRRQLERDIESFQRDGSTSLLPKWLPSINASNRKTVNTALFFCKKLGYSKQDYRKLLSSLRRGKIIENRLREKDYSFDYSCVPSQAMHKYRKAFERNDLERYRQYVQDVLEGVETVNTETLFPYQIIKDYEIYSTQEPSDLVKKSMQMKWDSLPRNADASNTIVVRDGSGSMTCCNALPLYMATSLAILFSEQLTGEFKNRFITFSSHPQLIELPDSAPLWRKLELCYQQNDCSNTDISKVYDLIYRTSLKVQDPEDFIKRVVIISDMEFDSGVKNIPTYEIMKEKFEKAGLPLPEIVYWNVAARGIRFPANKNHPNIRFLSGSSVHVLKALLNNETVSAVDLMYKALQKYEKTTEGLQKR